MNDGTIAVQWQEIARFLSAWSKETAGNDAERWLLNEFVSYLEEQGLMDEEVLTSADAFALATEPAADRAIGRVVEIARPLIEIEWGSPNNFAKKGKTPVYGIGWWATYPLEDADTPWGPAWFEWNLRRDDFRTEPRDSIGFFAGITFENLKASPFVRAGNEAWAALAGADGFERVQPWYFGLWRPLCPEQLLAERTIEAQAQRLAEWVLATFRRLADAPPPA